MRLIVDVSDEVITLTGAGVIQPEQLVKVLRTAKHVTINVCPPGMVIRPERRGRTERRQFEYTDHIPERRSTPDRRRTA